ncbi:MAG: YbgC/FadM family acyl-CoA thioesterase [Candidatus Ratteibacteria bacterium]
MANVITKKIYYHDTDAGGVVYYANYLKFFEEGRTQYLEEKGIRTEKLLEENIAFVVAKAEIEYKKPVRYKDVIEVITDVEQVGNSSIVFIQRVIKDNIVCCDGRITIVCVNTQLKPIRIPDVVRKWLVEEKNG